MIFVALLFERCREQKREIDFALADLNKAFDMVNPEAPCLLTGNLSVCRPFRGNFTRICLLRYPSRDPYQNCLHTGVKESCVLAPVLFNIYLVSVTILSRLHMEPSDGIRIRYRFERSVFNARRFNAKNLPFLPMKCIMPTMLPYFLMRHPHYNSP
ncbi:unnamed protein product [Acanthosepion pharaonis]|uniref:Reverse transcriptase domain-containing protein n=1 Tax=Acanthosepion pharaonis TaxID=158019 RepID=A0A812CD36_ACAPH|nr:unnamed protein product [Sepia pharaonis]